MDNLTDSYIPLLHLLQQGQYLVYIVQGLPLFVLNLVICLAFIRQPLLRSRNDCLLLAALAFDEALASLAFVTAGIGRLYLFEKQIQNELISKWGCLWRPWTICWANTEHTYSLTLITVSLDRFLSIYIPLRHGGFGKIYAYFLIGVSHAPWIFGLAYVATHALQSDVLISPLCYDTDIYPLTYYNTIIRLYVAGIAFSSCIYVLIGIKLCYPSSTQASMAEQANLKKQQRLTVTMGISSALTFVLLTVPILMQVILLAMKPGWRSIIIPIRGVIGMWNMLVNFVLYVTRHKQMRLAIGYLFKCKQMNSNAAAI